MNPLCKIFFIGLGISLLGSLPLGTMNVMATEISVQSGKIQAFIFAIAAVIIEVLYVKLALSGLDKVLTRPQLFRFFEWLSIAMITTLAAVSFIAAGRSDGASGLLPMRAMSPFVLGILLSATSPLHITFWFGWSTILAEKGLLRQGRFSYNFYIAGIGIGSLLGYAVFIEGGHYLINHMRVNQQAVSCVIGAVLFITALIQLRKIIRKSRFTQKTA
jgi:threonine/homoserine/homoserine lactone efflux protein